MLHLLHYLSGVTVCIYGCNLFVVFYNSSCNIHLEANACLCSISLFLLVTETTYWCLFLFIAKKCLLRILIVLCEGKSSIFYNDLKPAN